MPLRRRRPRRAAAVVGLLAGLALLVGAVLDGGVATPTRTDGADARAIAAVPHGDVAASTAAPREDHPSWGHTVPSRGTAAAVLAGLLALLVATLSHGRASGARASGPRHRAPALLAARHRGPPVVV